jgi:hypothetical protein
MERGVLVQTGSGRGRRARSSPLTFRRFGRAINTDEVFGTHRDQVLDVFRDANEPLTPKSVTEQLETRPGVSQSQSQSHFSHSAVRKILSRMAENGDLVRLKFGKYTLPQGQCHTVTVPGENDPDGRSVTV